MTAQKCIFLSVIGSTCSDVVIELFYMSEHFLLLGELFKVCASLELIRIQVEFQPYRIILPLAQVSR